MHMPGHKRNQIFSMDNPYSFDVTEVEGTDNLHNPSGDIAMLLSQMRRMYGTKDSFLLVNGSTCGILAAISATCHRGDSVIVARNCHRSVYHGIYLLDLKPIYVTPPVDEKTGISLGCPAEVILEKMEENPEATAVVLTSPTYEGVCSDIKKIASVVHNRGKVLIVDEAHGAHLNWMPDGATAMQEGADLVIESLHKTLPALTQTAVLHRCSERVQRQVIEHYLDIYETSSPSYVLMASVAQCMDWLHREGAREFEGYVKRLERFEQQATRWKHLKLWSCERKEPSKLVIDTSGTSWNGEELARILREEDNIETEMAAAGYVIAMTSVADTDEGFERLAEALLRIDGKAQPKKDGEALSLMSGLVYEPPIRCGSYEAMNGGTRAVRISDALGYISAEYVMVYPPGIPFLVPGEEIHEEILRRIELVKKEQLNLTGLRDKEAEYIMVYEP